MTESRQSPTGLWAATTSAELSAVAILAPVLAPWQAPVQHCYEAGVQAPTLPGKRHGEPDIQMAALFLKKALTDLRVVWLLLEVGYSSPAASVAASAMENALTVSALAGHHDRATELLATADGDIPWGPMQLAQFRAQRWLQDGVVDGKLFGPNEYELAWREVYSGYKWLCKIKHPTMRSATHDAGASQLASTDYVVMAVPDTREIDAPVKATVLTVTTNHVKAAIIHFAQALEYEPASAAFAHFATRLELVDAGLAAAYAGPASLPFHIGESKLAQEWSTLRQNASD
jgi:hypothetical protein